MFFSLCGALSHMTDVYDETAGRVRAVTESLTTRVPQESTSPATY
jgi:hypothetical protein